MTFTKNLVDTFGRHHNYLRIALLENVILDVYIVCLKKELN